MSATATEGALSIGARVIAVLASRSFDSSPRVRDRPKAAVVSRQELSFHATRRVARARPPQNERAGL